MEREVSILEKEEFERVKNQILTKKMQDEKKRRKKKIIFIVNFSFILINL